MAPPLHLPSEGSQAYFNKASLTYLSRRLARRARMPAREHRDAGRIAKRVLAVSAIKPHSLRGQLVNVRRLGEFAAVATDLCAQVIRDDEQHI